MTLKQHIHEAVKMYLEAVIYRNHGNVSRAAVESGKHRGDFYKLLKKYNVELGRREIEITKTHNGTGVHHRVTVDSDRYKMRV